MRLTVQHGGREAPRRAGLQSAETETCTKQLVEKLMR